MTDETDGGPAFLITAEQLHENNMSLRDWFAGQALSCLAGMHGVYPIAPDDTAQCAYEFADAMLKARKETSR